MNGLEVRKFPYSDCDYPNCENRVTTEVVLRGSDVRIRLCDEHAVELGTKLMAATKPVCRHTHFTLDGYRTVCVDCGTEVGLVSGA